MCGVTVCGFDGVGGGCVVFSFVAAALWLWWWPLLAWIVLVWCGCVGVVCELDSVFVVYACFLFLSCFLVGIACCVAAAACWWWWLCGGFFWTLFCSESLILAQDERWRRA